MQNAVIKKNAWETRIGAHHVVWSDRCAAADLCVHDEARVPTLSCGAHPCVHEACTLYCSERCAQRDWDARHSDEHARDVATPLDACDVNNAQHWETLEHEDGTALHMPAIGKRARRRRRRRKKKRKRKRWIRSAIARPGAFTCKARSHGMSTAEFARHVHANRERFAPRTVRQANLYTTLSSLCE